jgi:hypothetical protein
MPAHAVEQAGSGLSLARTTVDSVKLTLACSAAAPAVLLLLLLLLLPQHALGLQAVQTCQLMLRLSAAALQAEPSAQRTVMPTSRPLQTPPGCHAVLLAVGSHQHLNLATTSWGALQVSQACNPYEAVKLALNCQIVPACSSMTLCSHEMCGLLSHTQLFNLHAHMLSVMALY